MTLKPRTVIALAGAVSMLVAVELIQGQDAVKSGPDAMKDLTPEEHRRYTQWWDEGRSTFFNLQSSEPQTVAYALTDSPVGRLAWLTERFQYLTDNDGDFLHAVDRDAFLTDVTLYWVTGTVGSSMRIYCENYLTNNDETPTRLKTPVAYAVFPTEVVAAPEHWIEQIYDIVQTLKCRGVATSQHSNSRI